VRAVGAEPTQTNYLEGFGRWLFSETRGQPFYIIETLKALLERGLLPLCQQANGAWAIDFDAAVHSGAWVAHADGLFTPTSRVLPHSVREVIRARLEQVNPTAFALLVAGAVLGHDFTFEHLCQVAAIEENDGLPALDEVLINRLLAEGDGRGRAFTGTYVFTHDKIRDVVYTEAGEARRRVFHRRALEALQGTVAPAAELARHALAAGITEAAFQWSMAAGDNAMKLFAVRDAIPHYEQARSLLAEQQGKSALPAGFSLPAIQHLHVQLGRAYELINETEQARLVYEEMLTLARKSGSSTMEQTALNHLVTIAAQNPYELKQAEVLLEQTLQVAGYKGEGDTALPTIEEAETEWNQAQVDVYRFEPASALLHGERALTIARQLGQQELVARSLNVLGYALMVAGRWEEAERSLEEAAHLFSALGNRAMVVDSLSQAASSKINYGQPHAAISEARTAHTISIEIENAWGQVNSALPLAQGLLEIGAYAEASRTVQEAVAIAGAHKLYTLLGIGLILLGEVHRAMLNPDAARATHLEMMGMIEPLGLQPLVEALAAELCADCAVAGASGEGKWEEAHAYALQALAHRTDFFVPSTKLTRWYETEALARAGEIELAAQDVEQYGKLAGSNRRYRISHLRALAVLAEYRGEVDTAIGYLQEAATLAEAIGLPGELWLLQAAQGDLYLKRGEEEQARCAFGQAAIIVQKLADTIDDGQRAHFLSAAQVRRVQEMVDQRERFE
jgi:tetratricopeptide (TPR) repeat protein